MHCASASPKEHYTVEETFEITGRGLVVILDRSTRASVGRPHAVRVITPSGRVFDTKAYKEWLLRRQPVVDEKEAFWLEGLHKSDVPRASELVFLPPET